MAKILIIYYSKTGNTKAMAEEVSRGAKAVGAEVVLKPVGEASVDELMDADGIVVGSPTYYGHSASPIHEFIERSVKYHGRLAGKVGGAFASSANIGGGTETTILDLLHVMLIHGMIVQGSAGGAHYGPVAINRLDERSKMQCFDLGRAVAALAEKVRLAK